MTGEPSYTIHEEEGRRIVRHVFAGSDGKSSVFQHDLPDALTHYYDSAGIDEPILLYRGQFSFIGDSSASTYDGDIRFLWRPTPRIQARGERRQDADGLLRLMDFDESDGMWAERETVVLPVTGTLPEQPDEAWSGWSKLAGTSYGDTHLSPQEIGSITGADRLTFLVPNGWFAHDGYDICDPSNLMRFWSGRLTVTGEGWTVTVDARRELNSNDFRRALRDSGGYCVTHIGELRRADNTFFTMEEADDALETLRLAFTLALGRTVNCLLPVGWRDSEAVWTRWSGLPVDPYRHVFSWRDASVTTQQIQELIECSLRYCADPYRREIIRYATSYYVTANFDVDVEMAVAVPVSGLQLLAYHRFVEERNSHSPRQWDNLNTESQIRLLLDDCQIGTTIPVHFAELTAIATKLPKDQGKPRDALGAVIYLRNKIIHPTKRKPGTWTIYGWAEASIIARHFLVLAILNTVGYQGVEHSSLDRSRLGGAASPVPWATGGP